jgi:two-component system sensor histidine kinase UhpB
MSSPGAASYLPVETIEGQQYAPVIVHDGERGALIGLFSPQTLLARGLGVVANSDPVTVLVVDHRMEVLYQSGSLAAIADMTAHPGIQRALENSSGIDYLQTAGGEHVITYSPIPPEGWALLIEESWEDIASPLLRATQNAPLIIVPILALSLLALWFGMRQIVQPMQALEGKAGDLARGDFESIRQPVGGVPEIRRLQETLIDMSVQLKEAQNSLHNYIGAITASVENERHNLARELHDGTIQTLIAMGQYTQYALHWNQDSRVEKTLNQVVHLTEEGMKDLRQLIRGLRPIYIEDLGLSTALAMYASQGERPDGTQVHFHQEGKDRRLPPEVEMALYRMAQEALNNVHRHARASNVWITLRFGVDEVTLEVQDDGQGFDLPADPTHYARLGHYGLVGLNERADLIGAQLTIHSKPSHGTLVHVQLNAPEKGQQNTSPDQTATGA